LPDLCTACAETPKLSEGALWLLLSSTADARWELFGVGAPALNDLNKDVATEDEITGLNSEQEDIEMTDDRVVTTSSVLISQIDVAVANPDRFRLFASCRCCLHTLCRKKLAFLKTRTKLPLYCRHIEWDEAESSDGAAAV
jgi:hypothetical protein